MKFQLLIFIICFLSLQTKAQYVEYHNLINQANKSGYEKDYKTALNLYQEGFKKVSYVHSINYVKAARVALKLKQFDLVKTFLSEAVKRGYPDKIIDRKEFNKFRKSSHYLAFQNGLNQYKKHAEQSINWDYKHLIDSLYYIDQKVLRGNKNVPDFKLDPNANYSDSSNFTCLLTLIDQYGFPSEKNIGFDGYRKSWVIIHHSARLVPNHKYHEKLLTYVLNGDYMPENYGWVVDQGQELKGEELIYFHWDVAKNIDTLSIAQKDKIDLERSKIGMPSIRRIEVIKNKNKVKW